MADGAYLKGDAMNYVRREGRGSLFPQKVVEPNQPNFKGSCLLGGEYFEVSARKEVTGRLSLVFRPVIDRMKEAALDADETAQR